MKGEITIINKLVISNSFGLFRGCGLFKNIKIPKIPIVPVPPGIQEFVTVFLFKIGRRHPMTG